MSKRTLSPDELNNTLDRQLNLIKRHIEGFNDYPDTALDIATKIRVICHDTKNSISVLSHLGIKNTTVFSDTFSYRSKNTSNNQFSHIDHNEKAPFCGLVYIMLNWTGAKFIPKFDEKLEGIVENIISFDDWWNTVILRDYYGNELTRKDVVLEVADTDGGSHIDNKLEEKYYHVSRLHSLTWEFRLNDESFIPITGVELASICQIGYELVKAFDPNYIPPTIDRIGGMVAEFSMKGNTYMFEKPLPFCIQMEEKNPPSGIERNNPCRCGSGKKTKKCHNSIRSVMARTKPF